jgi:hypothetical protein
MSPVRSATKLPRLLFGETSQSFVEPIKGTLQLVEPRLLGAQLRLRFYILGLPLLFFELPHFELLLDVGSLQLELRGASGVGIGGNQFLEALHVLGGAAAVLLGSGQPAMGLVGAAGDAGGGRLLELYAIKQNLDALRGDVSRLQIEPELMNLGQKSLQGIGGRRGSLRRLSRSGGRQYQKTERRTKHEEITPSCILRRPPDYASTSS